MLYKRFALPDAFILWMNATASAVPSAYTRRPHTLCWSSNDTLRGEGGVGHVSNNKRFGLSASQGTRHQRTHLLSGLVKRYVWNAWPFKCASGTLNASCSSQIGIR